MVEAGPMGKVVRQAEDLDLESKSSWEESVNTLVSEVLEPAGFSVTAIARVQYLCQGDIGRP